MIPNEKNPTYGPTDFYFDGTGGIFFKFNPLKLEYVVTGEGARRSKNLWV